MFCQDYGEKAEASTETEETVAALMPADGGDVQTLGKTKIKHRAVNKLIHRQIWKHP